MGLFGRGKEKKMRDKDWNKMAKEDTGRIASMDFNALMDEKKREQDAAPKTELTEENLLRFLGEKCGKEVTMSTRVGDIYDYDGDPLADIWLQGDLSKKFGVELNTDFTGDTTVEQVMAAMRG